MADPTADIDTRAKGRPDLESRIENALEKELRNRLGPDADISTFNGKGERDTQGEGGKWWQVRAAKIAEDPPETGMWQLSCQIIGRGSNARQVDAVETMLSTSTVLSCLLADLASAFDSGFIVPRGTPSQLEGKTKTGTDDDLEARYNFTVRAQAVEISEAA